MLRKAIAGARGEAADPLGEPSQIGRYRILQQLGAGGMGVVYEAEQTEPVRRRVALKIIKVGMDTKQVVARFEAERQALAVLDHPNIASVFDGGSTESGRPYFVMELVQGIPITRYCDTHKLTTTERVRLFIDVCMAVQHAHHKGVIHRDLKPSNVLVTVKDDRPIPKVIDFGIAKAIGGDLTDRTLVTRVGQLIGTPAYMSPEQAEMSGLDVDTRTDVYSLGVMLYELLTGALPIDLAAKAEVAIRQAIRETDVPKPSTRLVSLGATADTIASYRGSTTAALKRELKGDLDWIVLKAMEKDRTRRYDTASGIAAELNRFLNDEPVLAGPPGAAYRVRKFVRRHRASVATAALVFILLLGSGITVSIQSARIAAERDKAVQVSSFLEDLFKAPDPFATGEERRDTLRVRDLLGEGAEKARSELGEQPAVQAHMLGVLGNTYRNVGQLDEARPLLEEAVQIQRGLAGVDDAELGESLLDLGVLLTDLGAYDEAEPLLRESLATRRGLDDRRALAETIMALGNLFQSKGEFEEAEPLYREALQLSEAGPSNDIGMAESLGNLATVLIQKAEYTEAEPLLRRALEIQRRELGRDHPQTLSTVNNLAYMLEESGDLDEAESLHREALALRRSRLGEIHPDIARSLNNLASVILRKGDLEEAETLFRESLGMRRALYGDRHPAVASALQNLAAVLDRRGSLDEAEEAFREARDIFGETIGEDHPAVATVAANLANVLHKRGDHPAAIRELETALAIRRDRLPAGHWRIASVLSDLGRCLAENGEYRRSEERLLEAFETLEARSASDPDRWHELLERLATLYEDWGRPDEAARYRARQSESTELDPDERSLD